VFSELIPDALEDASSRVVAMVVSIAQEATIAR